MPFNKRIILMQHYQLLEFFLFQQKKKVCVLRHKTGISFNNIFMNFMQAKTCISTKIISFLLEVVCIFSNMEGEFPFQLLVCNVSGTRSVTF